MKLVKDAKVEQLPVKKINPSSNIAATFKRAAHVADVNGWTKIIIVGQGAQSFGAVSSRMKTLTALGLLECGKAQILYDDYADEE